MVTQRQHPRRPRLLSRAQIILAAMIVLLAITLGATITLAYINLNTAGAFQSGYVLANLANVQSELTRLHVETNRVLRDRSKNLEPLLARREALDRQINIALAEGSGNPQVTAVLSSVSGLLEQYDYEVLHLSNNPSDAQYRTSAHQFDSILGLLEQQVQRLYGSEELSYYRDIGGAIKQQRTAQTLTIGIGGLILVFGVMLALSVGRSISGQFERANELLRIEVTERRHAEEELRQQNEYLAALHETTLALMNRLNLPDLLQAIVSRAAQLLGTEHGYVYLLNPAHSALEQRVGIGLYAQSVGLHARPGQGLAGHVWATRQAQVVNDYPTWTLGEPWPGLRDERIAAAICVPLDSAGQTVGAIGLAHPSGSGRRFSTADVTLLEGFAELVSLALDNAQLFAEAEERSMQVDALYQADTELYRHLDLSGVLNALVDVAVDVLKVDKSAFLIWDESATHLIPGAARGYSDETLARSHFEAGQGLVGQVVQRVQPVIVQDTTVDKRVDWHITYPEHIRSFMHVPVVVDGAVFGVFTVSYTEPRAFDEEDERLILALAQRAAMAITNARLYQQAQLAATLDERQRLARELHDAVTQTLFSASIIADVLPRLWERDPAEAMHRVSELRELTRGALAEMRTLLLELRPAALAESDLSELLHQLGEAATGRARIPVLIETEVEARIPADVKMAFYRIAQEALNNAIRHASPQRVDIVLRHVKGTVCLCIRDDGIGFDVQELGPSHMGLRIMRERAESIGASLQVSSRPGKGTEVSVTWRPTPLAAAAASQIL